MTKRHLLTTAALVIGLTPGIAAAQTAARTPAASAPAAGATQNADEPVSELGEIVVTSQRREERLRDVPLSVTAQSAEQLSNAGVDTSRDLTRTVPGLNFSFYGAWAQPAVRGVTSTNSSPGVDGGAVAVYLDGVYQPNQQNNAFELPDVQRVEVLRGPQGTLFGRNATGGAIQVITLDPTFYNTGHFTASAGYFDINDATDVSVKGFVSGPIIADKLAGSLALAGQQRGGYYTRLQTGDDYGDLTSGLIRGKLLWEPKDGIKFLLTAHAVSRSDDAAEVGQPLNGNTQARRVDPTAVYATQPWDLSFNRAGFVHNRNSGVSLRSTFDLGFATLTSITAYQKARSNTFGDYDQTASTVFDQAPNPIQWNTTTSQEFLLTSNSDGPLHYTVGAYGYHDKAQGNSGFLVNGVLTSNRYDKIDTTAYAGFGEVSYDLTDQLTIGGGVRYSWEEKCSILVPNPVTNTPAIDRGCADWDAVTPRVYVRYKLNDQVNLYANYSEGFKSGVFDSTSLIPANPETIKSYEVGAKLGGPRYNLTLTAFHYQYDDLQFQSYDQATQTVRINNAASAEITGFEAEGQFALGDDFRLTGNFAYLPTAKYSKFTNASLFVPVVNGAGVPTGGNNTLLNQDVSGSRMIRAPEFTYNITALYAHDFAFGSINGALSFYHSSDFRYEQTGRVKTEAYSTLNGNIAWAPANQENWQISLWGRNLTNEAYVVSALPTAAIDWVTYAPPREIGITVDYRF
jgi:iron complex outermembrane receptor protein